jgi:hypothetical protein
MKAEPIKYALAFDPVKMQPGCALLQAAFGGDRGVAFQLFNSQSWLIGPTPDMRMIYGTLEQWKKVASTVNKMIATEDSRRRAE